MVFSPLEEMRKVVFFGISSTVVCGSIMIAFNTSIYLTARRYCSGFSPELATAFAISLTDLASASACMRIAFACPLPRETVCCLVPSATLMSWSLRPSAATTSVCFVVFRLNYNFLIVQLSLFALRKGSSELVRLDLLDTDFQHVLPTAA